MNQFLSVEHREHITDKPYEEVVAAFNAATGSVEEGFSAVASGAPSDADFQRIFKGREGASGFMRFLVVDHGSWLSRFYNRPAKAVMIVLGNPLIAATMLEHDLSVGLNVPVRMYIYQDKDQRTRVAYDVPSSLMGNIAEAAKSAAVKLDEKLSALARQITGPSSA